MNGDSRRREVGRLYMVGNREGGFLCTRYALDSVREGVSLGGVWDVGGVGWRMEDVCWVRENDLCKKKGKRGGRPGRRGRR